MTKNSSSDTPIQPNLDKFTLLPNDVLEGEAVKLEYIPISEVIRWGDNPKLHNVGDIINSIETNGFRDPPAYDAQLGALVEGNGRTEALLLMMQENKPLPRGVLKNKDTQEWCMPILFGIDSKSRAAATRYAIDHNNLVMSGGDFSLYDISRLWDRDKYLMVLQEVSDDEEGMPLTVDLDDLSSLMNSNIFAGNDSDASSSSDQKGLLDDRLDDGMGEPSSLNSDNDDVVVWTITCHNVNIAQDVEDAMDQILDQNPGWDTELKRRGAKASSHNDF